MNGRLPGSVLKPNRRLKCRLRRNISPLSSGSVLGSTRPTALLSSFNGVNLNGNWTLFVADVSGGDVSRVTSWGVDISAVPEPGSLVEGAVAVLFLGGVIGRNWPWHRQAPLSCLGRKHQTPDCG